MDFGGDSPLRYVMYGLHLESSVPLPVGPAAAGEPAPDWVFRRAAPGRTAPVADGPVAAEVRCHEPCHNGRVVTRVHRGPGGAWLWNDSIGTCYVAPETRHVEVYPEPGVQEHALGHLLAGQVSIYLLHLLGHLTLHASAVVTEQGAIAFLGPKGYGKSTMAAHFLRRGAALLTDDALPVRVLDGVACGVPGLPSMRLWPDTVSCTLSLAEELPAVMEGLPKRVLALNGRYPFASAPAHLRALYVLDRYDPAVTGREDVVIRTVAGREALTAVLAQTAWRALLRPEDVARLLPVCTRLVAQAPVRILSFPGGYEHQAAVGARIMDDLEGP
jgi:hypothetical protein